MAGTKRPLTFYSEKTKKNYPIISNIEEDFNGKLFFTEDGQDKSVWEGLVDVGETQTPPPAAGNEPLVVNAGEDVTVMEGQEVFLDGKVTDKDNKIIRCDWTQLDSSQFPVELTPDLVDFTSASFTAPLIESDKEILIFQLTGENDLHEVLMDTVNVTVVTDEAEVKPPEKPIEGLPDLSKGVLLFDSTVIWANGKERTMTGHHEYDKYDKKTECAAGGHGTPRKWYIDGKGKSQLSGGMSRVYNHSPHQGKICLLQTFVWDSSLENFSLENFSRHNEGAPNSNKTGGLQNALHADTVGGKYESYHKSYHDLGDKTYPGKRKFKHGDVVKFALVASKVGTAYEETMLIDFDLKDKYEQVFNAKYIEKENPDGAKPQPLYWRWRVNGTAPKNITTYDVKFYQL